jgi:hypothetical protein
MDINYLKLTNNSLMYILRQQKQKRVGGIEPPSLAWKAKVLPLNYTRNYYYF